MRDGVSSDEWRRAEKNMNRKITVLTLCAVLFALCFSAEAQQPKKVPRLGYLSNVEPAGESARAEAIRLGLRERGYIEGQNIVTEYRYGEGKVDRYPELLAELVRLSVDIIVVAGGAPSIRAAMNATKTIPIVMMGSGVDPVQGGLVKSLARPGGNVTGVTNLSRELGGKRLELLKEAVPETCSCRGSLRSGQSGQRNRGQGGSSGRGPCAAVDYSAVGGASCEGFRGGVRRAK